ncbi:MAG: nitroreductase family protein [Omnitrophica WOR_2 bacterium]
MEVIEAIQKRRSIRHFKPDPVPDDLVRKLLDAARLAPSGGNCQPWKFIIVSNPETRVELACACTYSTPRDENIYQRWIADAPVVIVACGYEREATVRYYDGDRVIIGDWVDFARQMEKGPVNYESELLIDLAIALDHLSLAAVEQGLGTCWVGGVDEKRIKQILDVPQDMRTPGLMALGFPDKLPDPRPRKSLEEIVYYEKYH